MRKVGVRVSYRINILACIFWVLLVLRVTEVIIWPWWAVMSPIGLILVSMGVEYLVNRQKP